MTGHRGSGQWQPSVAVLRPGANSARWPEPRQSAAPASTGKQAGNALFPVRIKKSLTIFDPNRITAKPPAGVHAVRNLGGQRICAHLACWGLSSCCDSETIWIGGEVDGDDGVGGG